MSMVRQTIDLFLPSTKAKYGWHTNLAYAVEAKAFSREREDSGYTDKANYKPILVLPGP